MKPKRADAYFVCQQQLAGVIRETERILLMDEFPDPSPEKDMLDMAAVSYTHLTLPTILLV